MRVPLAAFLVAATLAGCAQPGDDKEEDPLFGLCPQWAMGGGEQKVALLLDGGNATQRKELGPAPERHLDRPLDLYRVRLDRFEGNGEVSLRAVSQDGDRLSLRDYRLEDAQVVPVVTLDASAVGHDFDVFLSSVLQDAPSEPAPASLDLTLAGGSIILEFTVTYHYKVCGA